MAEKLLKSADRAYNCHEVHIELFINEMGWLINNLGLNLIVDWPLGP
jgi:hypothetical protein